MTARPSGITLIDLDAFVWVSGCPTEVVVRSSAFRISLVLGHQNVQVKNRNRNVTSMRERVVSDVPQLLPSKVLRGGINKKKDG